MPIETQIAKSANQLINYIKIHPESINDHTKKITELTKLLNQLTNAIKQQPAENSAIDLVNKLLINRLALNNRYLKHNQIDQAIFNFQISAKDYLNETNKV